MEFEVKKSEPKSTQFLNVAICNVDNNNSSQVCYDDQAR